MNLENGWKLFGRASKSRFTRAGVVMARAKILPPGAKQYYKYRLYCVRHEQWSDDIRLISEARTMQHRPWVFCKKCKALMDYMRAGYISKV